MFEFRQMVLDMVDHLQPVSTSELRIRMKIPSCSANYVKLRRNLRALEKTGHLDCEKFMHGRMEMLRWRIHDSGEESQ
jgi:hypothetical protein